MTASFYAEIPLNSREQRGKNVFCERARARPQNQRRKTRRACERLTRTKLGNNFIVDAYRWMAEAGVVCVFKGLIELLRLEKEVHYLYNM